MKVLHSSIEMTVLKSLLVLVSICLYSIAYAQHFAEVAQSLGVNASYGFGGAQGGGISVADFNNDGWNDLTIGTENGRKMLFYVNQNGTGFQAIPPLVDDNALQKQILWVDYDNDDDLDLFFTQYEGVNRLYQNQGNLTFIDVTASSGLPLDIEDSFGAVFGDIDQDGFLDLFVSNYFFHRGRLFLNEGGLFREITDDLMFDEEPSTLNFCAAFYDHEKDGDLDLYLINDKLYENDLYINNGQGGYLEASASTGTNIVRDAMNAGVADINNDGLLDIYVSDSPSPGNALLKNNPNGVYDDIGVSAGVTFGSWCWGGSITDFDNDGFQDIYSSSSILNANDQNKLFMNNGDETFHVLNPSIMSSDTTSTYANSVTDFNNDGLMDIVTNPIRDFNIAIWQNQTITNNNFLKVKLEGTLSNRNGVGSWIELYTDTLQLYRFTHCGIAYLSQESYTNHFGVQEFNMVDSIIVRWPSGIVDKVYNVNTNQQITIVEDCPSCPNCEPTSALIDSNPIPSGNYHQLMLNSSGTVASGNQVLFRAKENIELDNDFSVTTGSQLIAEIRDCIEE